MVKIFVHYNYIYIYILKIRKLRTFVSNANAIRQSPGFLPIPTSHIL